MEAFFIVPLETDHTHFGKLVIHYDSSFHRVAGVLSPAVCIIEISFLTLHEEQKKQSQRRTQASNYADAEVNERFTHCSALHKGNQTVTANHIHFASAADNGVTVGAVHPAVAALCRGGGCGGSACVAAVRSDGNHLILRDCTVHLNLPEFVHVVENELEDGVARSGV